MCCREYICFYNWRLRAPRYRRSQRRRPYIYNDTRVLQTLEIPIYSESLDEAAESSPEEAPTKPAGADDSSALVRVRTGPQKKPPGFQACLACVTPTVNGESPGLITALTINSSYGLWVYTETPPRVQISVSPTLGRLPAAEARNRILTRYNRQIFKTKQYRPSWLKYYWLLFLRKKRVAEKQTFFHSLKENKI